MITVALNILCQDQVVFSTPVSWIKVQFSTEKLYFQRNYAFCGLHTLILCQDQIVFSRNAQQYSPLCCAKDCLI